MRKKCRRKVWSTNIDIIAHAIAGARITDETALNKIRLRELSCLDAMRLGKGTVEDWRVLVDMLNVTETFGKSGIGPECLDDCQIAQESLFKAAKRYESTQTYGIGWIGHQSLAKCL